MDILYTLTICDTEVGEKFFIGIYSSEEYALCTAQKYCAEIQGFKDYPCTYSITPKTVLEALTDKKTVYLISGWDIVDWEDVNIWESDLYTDKKMAEAAYIAAQKNIKRQEWSLDCLKINESHWKDGFVRITY